jgi:hypothetical protein
MMMSLSFDVVKNGYLATITRLVPVGPPPAVDCDGMTPEQVAELAAQMGVPARHAGSALLNLAGLARQQRAHVVERIAFTSKDDLLKLVREELEAPVDAFDDGEPLVARSHGVLSLPGLSYAVQRLDRGYALTITRAPKAFEVDDDRVKSLAAVDDVASKLHLAVEVFQAFQNRGPTCDRYVFESLEGLMASLRDDVPAVAA